MVCRSLCLSFLLVLVLAAQAAACSCAAMSPAERMRASDVAVYGRIAAIRASGDERVYTMDVIEIFKGEVGAQVEFRGANPRGTSFTSCSEFREVGDELGLYFHGPPEEWGIGTCNITTREDLEAGLAEFPPARGSGRAAFLLPGPFGAATFAAVDLRGRVLAYAHGRTRAGAPPALSPCPGGRVMLESTRRITVRRLSDLRPVRRLPGAAAAPLRCLRSDGSRAVTVRVDGLKILGPSGPRFLARGRFPHAAFGLLRSAAGGEALAVVEHRSGRRRELRRDDRRTVALALDGGERRVAELTSSVLGSDDDRVTLYDLRTGRQRSVAAPDARGVQFTRDGRLLVLGPEQARAYDANMQPAAAPVTAGADPVVLGDSLWYLLGGRLRRAPLAGDPVQTLGRLPLASGPLVPIPARPRVNASQWTPAYPASASGARQAVASDCG